MKLHTGELFWPQIGPLDPIEADTSIKEDREILIVGGGMSGAITAYTLSKAGYKVVLIEQNKIASGSSAANTGLIQYMSDQGLHTFIEQIGKKDAVHFYLASSKAVDVLTEINDEIPPLSFDTFAIKDSLILATEKEKVEDLQEEVNVQNKNGLNPSFITEEELEKIGIDAYGALKAKPDISLNPYGFIYRMIRAAKEKYDLQVFEETKYIQAKTEDDKERVILSMQGKKVEHTFSKVVFACGYNPPKEFEHLLENMTLSDTYVIVSNQDDFDENLDYLVWEVKDPYTYFKYTFDHRFMIGGLDEPSNGLQNPPVQDNAEKLIDATKEMLTDKEIPIENAYAYAAVFGESEDDLPYMGVNPENENQFIICGLGGNGTIYSTIGAQMTQQWVSGESLEEYDYLRLGR